MFNIIQYPENYKVYVGATFDAAKKYLAELAQAANDKGLKTELTETFLTIYGDNETVFSIEAE